ncbi:MAG: hypothetical protein KDB27_00985 [Planctomycetales bacterium]|nr:hypothetical protein [Planctomycetales bacterium]
MSKESAVAQREPQASPAAYYESRIGELDGHLAEAESLVRALSWQRGVAFFAGIGVLLCVFNEVINEAVGYSVLGLIGFGFLMLVGRHERAISKMSVIKHRRKIQRIQLARIERDWKRLVVDEVDLPQDRSVEAHDLNLFGKASLFQLVNRCHTPMGIETLAHWILNPASQTEVQRRQKAATVLADQMPLLEELELRGRMLASSDAGPQAFTEWAESGPWLQKNSALLVGVRFLTGLLFASVVLWGIGFVASQETLTNLAFIMLCVLMFVSGVVNVLFSPSVHHIFGQVNSRSNDIDWYRNLFQLIAQLPDDDPWLHDLKLEMRAGNDDPCALLNKLARIMRVANLRLSPLFGVIHIGIQLVTLLDFHTLVRLENWQKQHGSKVRSWFQAIGRFEAISSTATLVHDNPDWTFATVTKRGEPIVGSAVGHPLLHPSEAVANDVQVGPPGSFLLVTGSNMSGKSTLLRSIGINSVLAQMGAPVCANSWTMPPLIVQTSMRVQDSLEDGVSFFMAELRRLKTVVDRSVDLQSGEFGLLFLLDEILQGTNSVERHIAVARVIRQLVANEAIGAVSTHDLELSSNADIENLCHTVHFRELIDDGPDGEQMTFDYQMREGVAPSTNALKLLEIVGLSS